MQKDIAKIINYHICLFPYEENKKINISIYLKIRKNLNSYAKIKMSSNYRDSFVNFTGSDLYNLNQFRKS